MSSKLVRLALVATAAGGFSGLFGVGGGTVLVPLLVLWLGYQERVATGTSLFAIVAMAAIGAAIQALYGNVDPLAAAVVGVPALAGVVVGTWVQQRVSERVVAGAFAVVATASAVALVL